MGMHYDPAAGVYETDPNTYLYVGPFFIDGFAHYTDPTKKWHGAAGDGVVDGTGSCWGRGCIHWAGNYPATEAGNYLYLCLSHLKRRSIEVAFNFSCDEFTGAQFLRFYDQNEAYICGFGIDPTGRPFYSRGGADLVDTQSFPMPMLLMPGTSHELLVGVKYAMGDPKNQILVGMSIDGNPITGFGLPIDIVDFENFRVRHIRLGPMGNNTKISDVLVERTGFVINRLCNVATAHIPDLAVTSIGAGNCIQGPFNATYSVVGYAAIACSTMQICVQASGGGVFNRGATFADLVNYDHHIYVTGTYRASHLVPSGTGVYDITNLYHASDKWAMLWSLSSAFQGDRRYGIAPFELEEET